MFNIPDTEIILKYVLNGLFSLIVFLFIIRPLFKSVIKSIEKISGEPNNNYTETKSVENKLEMEKKRKAEEIRRKNQEIHEQAKKEVEQMENEVVAKIFEGKPLK